LLSLLISALAFNVLANTFCRTALFYLAWCILNVLGCVLRDNNLAECRLQAPSVAGFPTTWSAGGAVCLRQSLLDRSELVRYLIPFSNPQLSSLWQSPQKLGAFFMASIKANQIRKGMVLLHNGVPHRVLDFHHHTPGNLRAMVQTRMRNLKSGNTMEHRFSSTENVERAQFDEQEMSYLYNEGDT
jgi:hypothetical protein